MRLIKFTVLKMHGYIDVNIKFKDGMSIIVGGNGSGKTSALTLLANVLRVETEEIRKTRFEYIELAYDRIEKRRPSSYTLKISKIESSFLIQLYRGNELIAEQPLERPHISDLLTFYDPNFDKIQIDHVIPFQHKHNHNKNISTSVQIGAKVTFVRLDRAISAIDSHGGISFEEPDSKRELASRSNKRRPLRDPLEVVREVTSARYVSYRNELEKIKARTYEELFRIHFSDSDITLEASPRLDRLEKKISELEQRLLGSKSIIPTEQSYAEFQNYLGVTRLINSEVQDTKAARKSGRRTRLEEVLGAQLISRSRKIELLLRIFEQESTQTTQAYNSLSVYLETLNGFLQDSKKFLNFSPIDNSLYYARQEVTDDADKPIKDLTQLSSGEKQIVIMLTFLAFLSEPGSIFIVDEPELSLHLKWQRMLVSALTSLRPMGCQIILATHAPEIAGRARENCVRLFSSEED